MKKSLFFIALFLSFFARAQFGVVQDKDGFVNVRELENSTSQILAKIKSGTILSIDPEPTNPNWILVEYKPESNGYIYHDRLKKIEDFEMIKPSTITSNSVAFSFGHYQLSVEIQKFNPKNHKITKENDLVYAIDGNQALGIDGMMPTKEFRSFKIQYKNQSIDVPRNFYSNLFNTDVESFKLSYNKNLNQYYLFGSFSDGAASFDAVWVLENGKIVQHLAQLSYYA